MPIVTPETIVGVQKHTDAIRNICILAHVDHGKTSLSDSLLATNGIISARLAGKIRYLDSREDEQIRGITMESSAISLYYKYIHQDKSATEHLINLIDSPGHIDFSSEVSTASRLCDGALVLVDVVDGVCSQTVNVLRQCWVQQLKPILVFNKIDLLLTQLQMSAIEAYVHMMKLLEQCNAVLGSFFASDRMADDLRRSEQGLPANEGEEAEEDIYFEPEKGNVIFASAIDGWAFTIDQFAEYYQTKLGMKQEILNKTLWGDFYFDPKTKRIINGKHIKGRSLKPMFAKFILDNIWAVYNACLKDRNVEKLEKIIKSLAIRILPRELKSKDSRVLLMAIMSQWLPLSTGVLVTIIKQVSAPSSAQLQRSDALLGANCDKSVAADAVKACDPSQPLVAYVSKMISVPASTLSRNRTTQLTANQMRAGARIERRANSVPLDISHMSATDPTNDSVFEESHEPEVKLKEPEYLIGVARLYSGTIKIGQTVHVYGPKYDSANPSQHVTEAQIENLYLIMGRELIPLDEVPAGNIVGIGGLTSKVLKNGTLSTFNPGINMAGVQLIGEPIVRVALEPVHPQDITQLARGLDLLNQADSCVRIAIEDTGEHIMYTAGELHLERCLKDLTERFAGVEISVSKPIVPYRETIIKGPEMQMLNDDGSERGTAEFNIASGEIKFTIRVVPLPLSVTEFLSKSQQVIALFGKEVATESAEAVNSDTDADDVLKGTAETSEEMLRITPLEFKKQLQKLFDEVEDSSLWKNVIPNFGPRRVGSNILLDTSIANLPRFFSTEPHDSTIPKSYANNIITAFQLASHQGPLCAEPLQGVAVFVNNITVEISKENIFRTGYYSSQIFSGFREAVKNGFYQWSPRIMLAMYACDIQASLEVLGRVYGVVTRRRGRIVAEDMKEGTPFFTVSAKIPVVESFGFSEEISKRTSGAAIPQLLFKGFEIYDEDPLWVPTTIEELEDLGELAEKENIAKRYIDGVRERKGLMVDKKLVQEGGKQRIMKR